MSAINGNDLLVQMRALAARSQGLEPYVAPAQESQGFGSLLKSAVDHVNEAQRTAGELTAAFERGEADADVASVMVAMQKANISFQAAMQVRNRLVSAYQDIMNMPI